MLRVGRLDTFEISTKRSAMESIDWTGSQGGALAMAFGAGVMFITPILWGFIVSPLKRKVENLESTIARRNEEDIRLYRDIALKAKTQ
jgi:hypothetical protein